MSHPISPTCCVEASRLPPMEEDVVEIPLLLSGREISILERIAHQRGLTAGSMVRRLLREFLVQSGPVRSEQGL